VALRHAAHVQSDLAALRREEAENQIEEFFMADNHELENREDANAPDNIKELLSRRDFLVGLRKWSAIVIGGALLGGALPPPETNAAWVNGGGGWVNGRGGWINGSGGGGGWVNRSGGSGAWYNRGTTWANRGAAWVNGSGWYNRSGSWVNGGGGGGAWVNNRGGGGAWVNR
jgi:hypothetical protein